MKTQTTFWAVLLLLTFTSLSAVAQHGDHGMTAMPPAGHDHQAMTTMDMHANPIGLPVTREGGGTAWLPDSTPGYGVMQQAGRWNLMYHGAAHLAFDDMRGPRGDEKVVAPNWVMISGQRAIGPRDELRVTTMLSLDPLTVGGSGYPLLFQTGETWKDLPLVDRQHPHNYISELSARITHAIAPDQAVFLYAAPVGQPALGPVAFMHRTHALDNPVAPIGHHWQDSTHISYGVLTGGYQTRQWQLEASTFNGREPGEDRWAIDTPTFNSFSSRLSYNPTPHWAFQGSYAFLKDPELLHPGENAHRATFSAMYNRPLANGSNFQSTFVWGRNLIEGQTLDSFLIEGQLKKDNGWTPYVRYEKVQKNAGELQLAPPFDGARVFHLQQATVGVARDIGSTGDFQLGVGAQWMVNLTPSALDPFYGDNPNGWLVYLRIHPKQMGH